MILIKLKWTLALLLVAAIAACVTAGLSFPFVAGQQPQSPAARAQSPAVPKPDDQPAQQNGDAEDARRLQGDWQAVDGEKAGKPLAEDPKDFKISFKGDQIIGLVLGKHKFQLDTSKSPRELNIHLLDGKGKGQTVRMIYSLEKDELKLCMPLGPGSAAPREFKTRPGSNLLVLVLRRAPRDAAAVKKPDDLAKVKREWLRDDAAPDGIYQLSFVWQIH